MNWRSQVFLSGVALLVVLLVGGGAYLVVMQRRSAPQSERPLTPTSATARESSTPTTPASPSMVTQSTPTVSGRWVVLPSTLPGQATPTPLAGALVFRDPIGRLVAYVPSNTPPSPTSWQTYTNQPDGYSVNYPSDWIKVEELVNGHQQLALYPPGTNLQENVPGGPQGITLGYSEFYSLPDAGDPRVGDRQTSTVSGVSGQLYTESALSKAVIAVFPRRGTYFVLEASAESGAIIEIFQQMLASLKFL